MISKRIIIFIMTFFFVTSQIGALTAYGDKMTVISDKLDEGIICVNVSGESTKRMRIGIHAKNGNQTYFYTYSKGDGEIDVPLIFGNDSYSIELYEEVSDKYYKLCDSQDVVLQMPDYDDVYLASSFKVPWDDAKNTIKKAGELAGKKKNDFDKFNAIYEYVVKNITYDTDKKVESGYCSSPDETLNCGTGICIDYAVLMASMLRSLDIKCKLIYGYAQDMSGYHSWNEVYIKGKWVIVDPTKDAQCYFANKQFKYSKTPIYYKRVYTF